MVIWAFEFLKNLSIYESHTHTHIYIGRIKKYYMETRVDTHNYTYNYLNKNINKKQYTIK